MKGYEKIPVFGWSKGVAGTSSGKRPSPFSGGRIRTPYKSFRGSIQYPEKILPLTPSGYNVPRRGKGYYPVSFTEKKPFPYPEKSLPLRKDTRKVSLYPYTPLPRRGKGGIPSG